MTIPFNLGALSQGQPGVQPQQSPFAGLLGQPIQPTQFDLGALMQMFQAGRPQPIVGTPAFPQLPVPPAPPVPAAANLGTLLQALIGNEGPRATAAGGRAGPGPDRDRSGTQGRSRSRESAQRGADRAAGRGGGLGF